MTSIDHYSILETSDTSSMRDISYSYYKLAREFHPEGLRADVKSFLRLTQAYKVLIDPETRSEYDLVIHKIREETHNHQFYENKRLYPDIKVEEAIKIYQFVDDLIQKQHSSRIDRMGPLMPLLMMHQSGMEGFPLVNFFLNKMV